MKALTNAQGEAVTSHAKVAHDPEQVANERARHSKELKRCKDGHERDSQEDPQGATHTDQEAVDQYWNEQWDQYVRAVSKSRLPVDIQPEAFRNWLQDEAEKRAKALRYNTPLHQLPSLEEFDLRSIGQCRYGTVWMNNHLVVVVGTNGEVRIYLRKIFHYPVLEELQADDTRTLTPGPVVNYTARELFTLLKALRIHAVAAPLDEDVEDERGSAQPDNHQPTTGN